ncbi:MAG: AbrB/MazE/SpoVT family DNA-binding domain-containing protein [Candidatus Bathyarchaeia archaeon]
MAEEAVVKEVDSQGRIVIPTRWRRGWKSRRVILLRRGNTIELIPIDYASPSKLFDTIKVPEKVDLTDTHSVRGALLEVQGS